MPQARCAHCHRRMGDYAGGWASINGEPVCHPNVDTRPDCYKLCTLEHHDIPCDQPECIQDIINVEAAVATKAMPVMLPEQFQWDLDAHEH